jgi:hypothetical protein
LSLYVRGFEFSGRVPLWHLLVALAGCSTWAYWRCFPGIAAQIDASTAAAPDGLLCSQCARVEEIEIMTNEKPRRVVAIAPDVYREVGSGELLETDRRDGGAPYIWRRRPNYVWSRP